MTCNCELEDKVNLVEGEYYKLRDGRIGEFLATSRGEHMFRTSVRTGFYSTKILDGIKEHKHSDH